MRASSMLRGLVGGMLVVVAATLVTGCAGNSRPDEGRVSLGLQLPGGVTLTSVSWQVFSPGNAIPVASGTINTGDATATASASLSLPEGSGYTVTMTATTADGASCSGTSAAFNVMSGTSSLPVSVTIACGNVTPTPGTGRIVITGTVVAGDRCPQLVSSTIAASPSAGPGQTVEVAVSATDPDSSDVLSFAWSATAGSFANSQSASTVYTCATSGQQTLSVAISDDHTPTACSLNVRFPAITCP